jgi:uncharacterized protein
VEFTPKQIGVIPYSCWMGMVRSSITVVSDLGQVSALASAGALPADIADDSRPGGDQGAGSCCSGASDPTFAGGRVPVDTIGLPLIRNGNQEVTVDVSSSGYAPAALVLQKGMKAVIKFKVKGLSSCTSRVIFPEYNGGLNLAKGQLETPLIPITADFTFQCSMGMLHGYVKAVDNLAKVDIDRVKAEIGAYRASSGILAGAGGCCAR